MPWGLKRFQEARQVHFITFSCYRRRRKLEEFGVPETFLRALERVRCDYGLCIYAYVVMPEHVHLLLNEPQRNTLAQAIKALKQGVARTLALRAEESFWQARYYDFNVWSDKKFEEKLHYVHENPVRRELVKRPEDWEWSSFRHHASGETGVVEIESRWTARIRERLGIFPTLKIREIPARMMETQNPRSSGA